MFEEEGYQVEKAMNVTFPLSEEEEKLKEGLMALSSDVQPFMYEAYQYAVAARMY